MRNTHTLKWFVDRVGGHVFRRPMFDFEEKNGAVAVKVRSERHATTLHKLQQNKNVSYKDQAHEVEL